MSGRKWFLTISWPPLPFDGLNQKFLTVGVVAALLEALGSSSKANSPSPVQTASTPPRIASSGWMIGWMPPQTMYVEGLSSRSRLMTRCVRSA